MQAVRLSVALVTRNRPASLERTLRSLRAQNVQPWEVVISDDSDAEPALEVQRLAAAFDCRYLRGPTRGLYANRNHVALACGGTHIRTMDDDHEFPDGHLQECLNAIERDPDSIWIIGEYYPTDSDRSAPPVCPGELQARGFSLAPPDPDSCWAISDGASTYPRVIFERGIRYVESFKFGAAYLEFGSRLYALGYRMRQLKSTYVLHYHDPAARSFAEPEAELASKFFAMLCHSYLYQPTMKNRLSSATEIAKEIALRGGLAARAARTARAAYQQQRKAFVRPA